MTKVVNLQVGMTCGGCAGAVTRILNKIEGKIYFIIYII
jgi:copper chaperone CopZ